MNCWEFMGCSRVDNDASSENNTCPAYPSFGKNCARVTGTLCTGQIHGSFAVKLGSCLKCDFYNSQHYDRDYSQLKQINHRAIVESGK